MTDSNDMRDRLQRLEEAAGFTEHTVDQLSHEIAAINETVRRLERRIESLTSRLESALNPETDDSDQQ